MNSLVGVERFFLRNVVLVAVTCCLLVMSSCQSEYPNRSPLGQRFPSVKGTALTGKTISVPHDYGGKKCCMLLGYIQDAQFDIDRWLIALDMTKTEVEVIELPTIQGMFPRMFKTKINDGMRSGIPKELWGGVVTIYEEGETVQRFTGNQDGLNARVILLDDQGEIIFFHDRGFSVPALNELKEALKTSRSQELIESSSSS